MKKRKEIKISKKNKKAGKNINNKFLILFQNIINRIRLYAADTANFKVIAGIATVAVIVCIYGIIAVSGAFIKISPATPSSADMAGSDAQTAQVMALSPTGAQFPSLNMEVPTTAPVPEFIRIGVQHPIIKDLQERLMYLGFMENDEPSDYYGPVTEAAVKIFQRQNDLSQDGIVGRSTYEMIMAEDAKFYAAKNGDSGDDIYRIQSRLYELGYLAEEGQVSGSFGDKTEEAVKKLQEVNSLEQDGKVGLKTLNLIYSDQVKANLLAYGEKSDVVLALQKKLFELGYMTSVPDGSYGDDTIIAVKAFQSKNDQVVDGYLGPSTRAAILSGTAIPNGLSLGDQSEQVKNVQKMLNKWGYLPADNISGYFGEETVQAVKAFQSRNSLSADGSVGAFTIAKLTAENAVRPAPVVPKTTAAVRSGGNNNRGGNSGKSNKSGGGNSAPAYTGGGGVGTLLSVASSKVGTPYVWGAKGPGAFDCSGFVYWCLNNAGVNQSYLTSSGWQSVGKYTRISSFSDLRAGDIVVVSGHVGICAGGGAVIDASSSNGRVVTRSLGGWWQRNFIVGWRIF
jgi:peptidoglycan-binding domain 1 protein